MTTEVTTPTPPKPTTPTVGAAPSAVVTNDMFKEDVPSFEVKHVTAGEKAHLILKQGVINTALNMTIGFAVEWCTQHGQGKGRVANWLYNINQTIERKFTHSAVRESMKILWLTTGGNILVPVIKWMDDFKLPMVQAFDRAFDRMGKGPDEAELAAREQAYARIAQEDHPSWGRAITARLSGMAWNMSTAAALKWADYKLSGSPTLTRPGEYSERFGYARPGDMYARHRQKIGKPLSQNAEWFVRTLPIEAISTLNTVAAFAFKYEVFDKRQERKHKAAIAEAQHGAKQWVEETLANPRTTLSSLAQEAAETAAQTGGQQATHSARLSPRAASYAEHITQQEQTRDTAPLSLG